MKLADIIKIEPGKRGGKPCIKGMRITVYDVLVRYDNDLIRNSFNSGRSILIFVLRANFFLLFQQPSYN